MSNRATCALDPPTVPDSDFNFADRVIDIASGAANTTSADERRARRRLDYEALVALVLIGPTGARGQPLVVKARDLSITGMGVVSRHMMYPGSQGALQIVRTDGRSALVGVQVRHSRYIGNMEHYTGLKFIPLPAGISTRDFIDRHGRMVLLDPALKQNHNQ
jgi:hypothetical protein